MVLVDTSIWINLFSAKPKFAVRPDQIFTLATCLPIVQEVLQGYRDRQSFDRFKSDFLALPCLAPNIDIESYIHAAEIFREGRRKGYTIRSSIDCLIAAIAIEHKVPVWHLDRDYELIAAFTSLDQRTSL
jgi:predicted nucleic acid-binding protein